MDWINLAEDRETWPSDVIEVMNNRVPLNVGNFLTSRETATDFFHLVNRV